MAEAGVGFVGCVKRDLFFAIFKFSWSALQTRLGITVGYLHGQGLSHRVRIFDRFCASMSGAHHFLSSLLYFVCCVHFSLPVRRYGQMACKDKHEQIVWIFTATCLCKASRCLKMP